jgi:hypothetical protein
MLAYDAAGIDFPHYSGAMYEDTERVPLVDIEPGDLLFYGYDGDQHVAMYVGDGKMIEAEMTGTRRAHRPGPTRLRIRRSRSPAGLAVSGVPLRSTSVRSSFTPTASAWRSRPTSASSTPTTTGARRLRRRALRQVRRSALIVAVSSGARLANIATNWSYYSGHPVRWIEVWQGGLASFGGLALAVPVGLFLQRRWWPGSSLARFTDALVPALIAGWALGRVLGPQFMVNGGGHLTHQWFGLHYAGQSASGCPCRSSRGRRTVCCGSRCSRLERRALAPTRRGHHRGAHDRLGSGALDSTNGCCSARSPTAVRSACRSPASRATSCERSSSQP